jgi:segregation and condensation protein B
MSEPFLEHTIELGAPSLPAALESVLLVSDVPLAPIDLATAFGVPEPEVLAALEQLAADYRQRGSGIDVRQVAGGWRLYTNVECQVAVERFIRDGQNARLTQAALETLAIVAYRQPISRGRIAAIRGVNVDGVVRTLVQRGLIEPAGQELDGQSIPFRTTAYFLERMGLRSLSDLPEIAEHLPGIETLTDLDASL